VGVKAAVAVGTAQEAEALLGAGAGRIGTPHAVAIVENYAELRRAS
jgi:deoxyribose-phosphate aldolase